MKYIIKKIAHKLMLMFLVCIMIIDCNIAFAESLDDSKSIVFLLDASGSMEENDPERLALDSAVQLIYSLPSNYKVGIVAYSNNVVLQTELVENEDRNSIVNQVENIKYDGYSNAGKGLEVANNLLVDEKNSQIIMLSDGEILLDSETNTSNSKTLFNNEIEKAKECETEIHFIGLADESLIDSEISKVSTETDGSVHYAVKALDIQDIIDEILITELNIKKTSLGVTNTKEESSEIKVNLLDGTSTSRILITSTEDILELVGDFEAESAKQDVGKRYAFIELKNPLKNAVNLNIKNEKESEVSIEVVSEFSPIINTNIEYRDSDPEDKSESYYRRIADIEIEFINEKGKEILKNELFEGMSIDVIVNGERIESTVESGNLTFTREVTSNEELEIQVDLSNQAFNIINLDKVNINLEGPLEFKSKKINYELIIYMSLVVIILLLIIILSKYKKKQDVKVTQYISNVQEVKDKKRKVKYKKNIKVEKQLNDKKDIRELIGNLNYTGKFNIYITKTKKDLDFPPLTFNLFHVSNGRKISLGEILKKLDIEEVFDGAENIYFTPNGNRKVTVTNLSDCTIMRTGKILLKYQNIDLFTEDKLDISFEDEVSELMLQYKDTK